MNERLRQALKRIVEARDANPKQRLAADLRIAIEISRRVLADEADGWIPVGERVPEQVMDDGELIDPLVIVHAPSRPTHRVGRYVTRLKQWRYDGSNSDFSDEIIMWRPFPEPPEAA